MSYTRCSILVYSVIPPNPMFAFVKNLFVAKQNGSRAARLNGNRKLHLESLESRELLSVSTPLHYNADVSTPYEINSTTLDNAQDLTVLATFKTPSASQLSGFNYLFTHDGTTNQSDEFYLRIRDGKFQFGTWHDGANSFATSNTIDADTWYTVVGVYDWDNTANSATMSLYVNGTLADSATTNVNIATIQNSPLDPKWYVGRHGTPSDQRTFRGEIAGVAVWNEALGAVDIVDAMLVNVIDLDIDSDNTGLNAPPVRSELEEYLELHSYAPGKVIAPNWGDADGDDILNCWDGYSTGNWNQSAAASSGAFTPIIVGTPAVDIPGLSLQFIYTTSATSLPIPKTTGYDVVPTGNGEIRIWTKNGTLSRTVSANYVTQGWNFSLSELGWQSGDTSITLYVEGICENIQTTRALAEQHGKPNSSIQVNYRLVNGGVTRLLGSDEVYYVVAKSKSFYYELATHPELVATYASSLIYDRESKEGFALKIQNNAELTQLGISNIPNAQTPSVQSLLSTKDLHDGLNAALYREYMTGKYVLAFAGTSMFSFDDWQTNYQQAFAPGGVAQYTYAIAIASALVGSPKLNASNTYITGHSLGGGLASAAAIESGFHAYTFNAAGLHPNTVLNQANWNNANNLVTSYKVSYDILSWGQYIGGWLNWVFETTVVPTAIGQSVGLNSEYDWTITVASFSLVNSIITQQYVVAALNGVEIAVYGVLCHGMGQVTYGMEQRVFSQ